MKLFFRLHVLIALLVLAGCGGIAQVPTPVPTATATPVPTATPLPTATPAPTATPLPEAAEEITKALTKTAEATSYRIAVRVSGQGTLQGVNLGDRETEVLDLEGTFSDGDYEYVLKGALSAVLGVDPANGLQIITADGVSYLRGPVPFLGANEDGWYELSSDQSALASPAVTAGVLGTFFPARPVGFEVDGTEQIDGESCTIYVGSKEALTAALDDVTNSGLPGSDALAEADEAELRTAICPDGYIHRIQLAFSGQGPEAGGAGFSFTTEVELSDFGSSFAIEAPDNARQLTPPVVPTP
jgi:hypothetical protein